MDVKLRFDFSMPWTSKAPVSHWGQVIKIHEKDHGCSNHVNCARLLGCSHHTLRHSPIPDIHHFHVGKGTALDKCNSKRNKLTRACNTCSLYKNWYSTLAYKSFCFLARFCRILNWRIVPPTCRNLRRTTQQSSKCCADFICEPNYMVFLATGNFLKTTEAVAMMAFHSMVSRMREST